MKGKVRWFNRKKGFGFIEGGDGQDIFVHYSDIKAEGFKVLGEGQSVEYEEGESEKGKKAVNVVPVD